MRVLFIGGTGNISSACARLAVACGHDLTLLTRGLRDDGLAPAGANAKRIACDVRDRAQIESALGGAKFDVVANFIAFDPADVERDIAIFGPRTGQYIFISSASAYQKPPSSPFITESTPLSNPFWAYSRAKIACEERLVRAHRDDGLPMTIVRPSHTYETVIPVAAMHWDFTIVERMRRGDEIVVHGDGTSLWTMTHSEDFAAGLVGLFGHPHAVGQAFHITSDEVLSWDQIYLAIGAAAGIEPKLVHIPSDFIVAHDPESRGTLLGDKSHSVVFDNSKIKRAVPGFSAKIPFHLGIRRTLAWFLASPERMRVSPASHEPVDRVLAAWRRTAP